jgi:four helix bundle protein
LNGWTKLSRFGGLAEGNGDRNRDLSSDGGSPKNEIYGLSSQLKRAIVSVPSNIAEGQGRNSAKEFVYHLSVAYGSLMEAETQIQIAANLSYLDQGVADKLFQQTAEIGRMLNGLSRSLS